jgi:hypothetical protein
MAMHGAAATFDAHSAREMLNAGGMNTHDVLNLCVSLWQLQLTVSEADIQPKDPKQTSNIC